MSYHMDVVRSLRSDKGKRRASASTEPGTKPPPGPTKKASTRNKTSHKRTTIMSPRAQAPPTDCTVLSSPRLADTTSAPGSLPPSSESSLSAGVGALSLVVSSRTSRLLKELEEASASTSLREIIIPNRKIGNEDAEMLCQALSTHTTMEILDLSSNGFCISATVAVASLLGALTQLHKLTLDYNMLFDPGTAALADALPSHPSLQHLSLRKCGISGVGAECIAHALRGNTTLTTIDIQENECGDEGAFAFARLLGRRAGEGRSWEGLSLTSLGLERNKITRIGAKRLCDGLKGCSLTLRLGANQLGRKEEEELGQRLASLPLTLVFATPAVSMPTLMSSTSFR